MSRRQTRDRPPVAKGAATVSASALALHIDVSHTYVAKLEAEGVIQRQGDGFPLDQSRVAYLRYLRRERRRSPRSEADADHIKVKTEMLQLKLAQQKGEIVSKADFDAMIDTFAGVTRTALSSLPARCAPRCDLATRRAIERAVFEVRTVIAKVCLEMADNDGEPPLEHQGLTPRTGCEVRFRVRSRLIVLKGSSSVFDP